MEDLLKGLNAAQLEAVTSTEGYIRVIAGAGAGKTRALSGRFAFLVNEIGILPENILCVTFTNKAANEMRQRIHHLTGDNDTGYINTFHGFCVSVLQEDSHAVQYPKSFVVLDNSDIDAILRMIYEERGLTLRNMTFAKARDMIEIRKILKEPEYYLDMITMPLEVIRKKYEEASEIADIIFYGYLYQEKKCFGLDYNDLIKFTLYIFDRDPDIRLKWQQRLEYIMIDEFQDIDALQYELMCVLCAYHRNLFIVGDPDQTIYSWRGADVRYLMDFEKNFPNVKTIMMMENYRSSRQIIEAVNSLIDKNTFRVKKDLIPVMGEGDQVVCHMAENAEKEAQWIAEKVKELRDEGHVAFRDITILYRAHYVTRAVEEAFLRAEIPYTIYSGTPFFGRKEIKDALSYLRMIAYRDDLSFQRIANVPKRNLGEQRMKFLQEFAEQNHCTLYRALEQNIDQDIFKRTGAGKFIRLISRFSEDYEERPISELLADILDQSKYEEMLRTEGSQERLDNLAELKQSIHDYEISCGEESTMDSYLRHIALFSNSDAETKTDKVKLMTVHSAKGLEFPYVILCGMNEGIFPSRKTMSMKAMEEERRLAFVAMTRAEKGLFLTGAEGRNFDGSPRYPSRFILDIDQKLIVYTKKPGDSLLRSLKEHIKTNERIMLERENRVVYPAGTKVRHTVFGEGLIEEVDEDKEAYVIRFRKMDTARMISWKVRLVVE